MTHTESALRRHDMRVLFLTQRVPYAPNRGDRVRAFHLLRVLREFAAVDVVAFAHDSAEFRAAESMTVPEDAAVWPVQMSRIRNHLTAVPALLGPRPLTHLLLRGDDMRGVIEEAVGRRPDVVLAFGSGMARFCTEDPLRRIPLVLDMVDADSAKWASLAASSRFPMSWIYRREARTLGAFEAAITASARCTTVVNEREREVLRRTAPHGRIEVLPNGVDVDGFRAPGDPADSEDVVFCGVMNYPPNEEGAVWLAREIWPLVRVRRPEARLLLVGASPSRRVRGLASDDQGVVVTGGVPDVRPYLWRAAAAAAPLLLARGVQNKVLEAVAAGLPSVITPAVAEGLPASLSGACRTAGTPAQFAQELTELLSMTPARRRAMAARAELGSLGWRARLAPVRTLLEEAIDRPAQSSPNGADY